MRTLILLSVVLFTCAFRFANEPVLYESVTDEVQLRDGAEVSTSILVVLPDDEAPKTFVTINGPGKAKKGSVAMYEASLVDSEGKRVEATENMTVNLAATGSGKFYDDEGGQNEITSVQIVNGTSGRHFYYRDDKLETIEMTASAEGATSGKKKVEIVERVAKKLTLTGPSKIQKDKGQRYEISALDEDGKPMRIKDVSLSAGDSGRFSLDLGGEFAITRTDTSDEPLFSGFYFTGTKTGKAELVASLPESEGVEPAKLTVEVVDYQVDIDGPKFGSLSVATKYTVSLRDTKNRQVEVTEDTTVTLTLSHPERGGMWSDEKCTKPLKSVVIPKGQKTAVFYFMHTGPNYNTVTGDAPNAAQGFFNIANSVIKLK